MNRLKRSMRLQTDPTVIYGMGDRFDGNIRKRDLSADTPLEHLHARGCHPRRSRCREWHRFARPASDGIGPFTRRQRGERFGTSSRVRSRSTGAVANTSSENEPRHSSRWKESTARQVVAPRFHPREQVKGRAPTWLVTREPGGHHGRAGAEVVPYAAMNPKAEALLMPAARAEHGLR
jgi:hypothetical protein